MIFCRSGAKGVMVSSILLPLAFSYSATAFRSDTSSSLTNPWAIHRLAVVPAALAMRGGARRAVAPRATDPRSTERLVTCAIAVSSLVRERCSGTPPRPLGQPGGQGVGSARHGGTV